MIPPRCQAYLIIDATSEEARAAGLTEALRARPVTVVLLLPGAGPDDLLRAQVAACQASVAAVLIEGDAARALAVGADGIHLPHFSDIAEATQAYGSARAVLGAGRVVGVSAGLVRHDAMVLGELGSDYVAFEDPTGADPAALADIVAWWAELFEVPCVAFAAMDESLVARLAEAGADFVAVGSADGISAGLDVLARIDGPVGAEA
jgi:thiamine-phosphate pyrophosphorylase